MLSPERIDDTIFDVSVPEDLSLFEVIELDNGRFRCYVGYNDASLISDNKEVPFPST